MLRSFSVFALLLTLLLAGCSSGDPEAAPSPDREPAPASAAPQSSTPASDLATIDADTVVSPDDASVRPYEAALLGLDSMCTQDERRLADFTYNATEQLSGSVTQLTMLRAAYNLREATVEAYPEPEDCSPYFATIISQVQAGELSLE